VGELFEGVEEPALLLAYHVGANVEGMDDLKVTIGEGR
jgi:hypothetical protein